MAKKRKNNSLMTIVNSDNSKVQKTTDIGRGTINHSAIAALVTSKVFTMRVEKAKKGKGSFNRKIKHKSKESYQIAA